MSPGGRGGVALVLPGGLGDTVRALPVAAGLRRAAPDRPLVWVLPPLSSRLLQGHPCLDGVVPYDRKAGREGYVKLWRDTRELRPELVLNLERYAKGLLPSLLLGGRRIGFGRPLARELTWLFHHERVAAPAEAHERRQYLAFLDHLGVPAPDPGERHLSPTAEERREREAFFERLEGAPAPVGPRAPRVGLVLASGRAPKDWPPDRSAALARRLTRELGARVILVGGPTDREEEAARVVRQAEPAVVDARSDDVRRLVWLLEACDACVAPDTGPLLVASEVGTPVVALFGHTNPWRVGPWPLDEELLVDRYTRPDERPDPSRTEGRSGNMERITVEEVSAKVARALERGAGEPRRPGAGG